MKKLCTIILFAIICLPIVACTSTIGSVEAGGISATADGRFMEVNMIERADLSAGCETWKKDEEIVFTLTSKEKITLEIGILPVLEDGSYGEIYGKECDINLDEKIIEIKVPSDGEYGIGFINKTDKNVSFEVELNKSLENPLV